ncbi:MAG TPA: DinB family protein [Gemmatimonadales bacterium]|nr:DinB family protein [Gemmatimonadales bacterium]
MAQHGAVWLRGPVPDIEPLLQPVAHALLQVAEDLPPALEQLSAEQLWARPGGSAPIGFHVAHLTGSLDRLFTYARGESLNSEQLAALEAERSLGDARPALATLLERLSETVDRAMEQLRTTTAEALLEKREVGRAKLPSTTLGLLFHAAEHSTRHAGQIATLLRVISPSL